MAGSIVSKIAFPCPRSTYDNTISHLEFIDKEELTSFSNMTIDKVPIRYYQRDAKLRTMIVCHGNSEDIGETNPERLAEQFNVNICLFDYAGYGLHSCKEASEYNCQTDVLAVYEHLIYSKNVPKESIIVYGRSIGTGPAVFLADHLCKRGLSNRLILVSPLYATAYTKTNCWIPGDIFQNYRLAKAITCPTLILHGNRDEVIPYEHGMTLASLFPNLHKFVTLEGCGHNDLFTDTYYSEIGKFCS
jgi:pimeloyl-ACP methyl ester carboxylesterase